MTDRTRDLHPQAPAGEATQAGAAGLNRRRLLTGAAGLGVAAPALIGKAIAAGEVTWRVQSHWPKASGSFTDSLGVLNDELVKRSDGRMSLQLFGAGEFAKGPEIFNLVSRGVVQMGTISPSYVESEASCAGFAYGIPGTLRETWEVMDLLKNLGVEEIFASELADKGVYYRSEKAYPTELVLSTEVESVEDFKKLKLRSSGTMLEYLAAAGASPSYIPGSELYQALSSGVVDGAHWGAAIGAQSMSMWEVCKYHMKPALGYTADGYIVNADALEALPEDLRLIFTSLLEERFFRRSVEYEHKEAIALSEGIRDQDVIVKQFPADVLALFAEASSQIVEKEGQKSEKAAECAALLNGLMKDLGYT